MKKIFYAKQTIDAKDINAVAAVLRSNYLTQGPQIEAFEEAVAEYCGAKYAVAVNSGTSALHIACLASGLKANDEGITSAITFAATSNAMLYCGARPVFADIDDASICVSPEELKKKINRKTRVIIPVHFAGTPCEMDKIYKIAKPLNIPVIEDACHALGASFRGSRIGSCKYSDMTILSFHAVKHITCGEGGMVLTNNRVLYQRLLLLRSHGISRKPLLSQKCQDPWQYDMQELGFNFRLTDIQCALGYSQLKKLGTFIKQRRAIVERYTQTFSKLNEVTVPYCEPYAQSSHHLYVLRFDFNKLKADKREIYDEYKKRGIILNVHYMPVYYHSYYAEKGYKKGICPKAEKYYHEAFTLPLFPRMNNEDIKRVIETTEAVIHRFRGGKL